jgi:hypothetical protein
MTLEAALALADEGLHVFPVGHDKRPRIKRWEQEATLEEARIRSWWGRWPDAMVGVAPGRSGLVVVDVDVKAGKVGAETLDMLELEHGALPRDRVARTATGGLHIYLTGRHGSSVGATGRGVGEDVDVKGIGGYVVGPGSVLPGVGEYSWVGRGRVPDVPPAWRDALPRPRAERAEHRAAPAVDRDAALLRGRAHLLEDAAPAVEGSGGDATTFGVACDLRDLGVDEADALALMLEHYNPRCEPPWDPDDLEAKVRNAYEYARGEAGSLAADADFPDDADEGQASVPAPRARSGLMDAWVWVVGPKWFVRRSDGLRLDRQSFDSKYDYVVEGKGHLSDEVFHSRDRMRKLMSLQFTPGEGEFVGEDYNLWRPGGVEPLEGGDGGAWLWGHLLYLCGGKAEEAGHVADYLAHLVQRRGEKLTYALLLCGGQGIGKSALGALLSRLLGAHNVRRPTNEELHGSFTAWALATEVCVIEELMAVGRREMANKLKPLITEPSIRIEEKHRTPYTIDNHMNFVAFTNWRDAIPIEHDDRRYLAVVSEAEPRDRAYYDGLWAQVQGDGAGRALGWLLARDLSAMNPKGKAPDCGGKELMRRAGMGEVEAWLLERFEAGEAPLDVRVTSVGDVVDALPERLRRLSRLGNVVGAFLRSELGARDLGQHRVNGGSTRRVLWAVRDVAEVEGMPAVARAREYDDARSGRPKADVDPLFDDGVVVRLPS